MTIIEEKAPMPTQPFIFQFLTTAPEKSFLAATEASTSGQTGTDGSSITDTAKDSDHHTHAWGL